MRMTTAVSPVTAAVGVIVSSSSLTVSVRNLIVKQLRKTP